MSSNKEGVQRDHTTQYNALYDTIHFNTLHYTTMQCNTIQSNAIQSNAKHSTM